MSKAYPCSLPSPLISGYSFSDESLTVFNEMDAGPPIARLKSDEGYSMFSAQFSFSAIQMQVFRSWYRSVIKHGSKTFTINLNIDGATIEHICYMSPPNYSLNGKRWNVQVTLTSIEFAGLNDCDGESVVNLYNGNDAINENLTAIEDLVENVL